MDWRLGIHIVGALLLTGAQQGWAQGNAAAFPQRPVRFIVPLPPGGGADVIGRVLAQKLTDKWGQPFLLDNRSGANGFLGMTAVASAAPEIML